MAPEKSDYQEPEIITTKSASSANSATASNTSSVTGSTDPKAIISLVLASFGFLINLCVPLCGMIFTVISFILSLVGLAEKNSAYEGTNSKLLHQIAIGINVFSIVLFVILMILPIFFLGGIGFLGALAGA